MSTPAVVLLSLFSFILGLLLSELINRLLGRIRTSRVATPVTTAEELRSRQQDRQAETVPPPDESAAAAAVAASKEAADIVSAYNVALRELDESRDRELERLQSLRRNDP